MLLSNIYFDVLKIDIRLYKKRWKKKIDKYSILQYIIRSFYLGKSFLINRHGAEAARWAHNPEDTGSKPVVGI